MRPKARGTRLNAGASLAAPRQDARASLRDERAARATVTDALLGHAGRLRRKYRHLEGRYDELASQYAQVGAGGAGMCSAYPVGLPVPLAHRPPTPGDLPPATIRN